MKVVERFAGHVGLFLLAGFLLALLAGCGSGSEPDGGAASTTGDREQASAGDAAGERITIGGTEALVWGEGSQGVVLSHGAVYDAASWEPQAKRLADSGFTALAVEETTLESIASAAEYLKEERGAQSVALIGASAGAGPVLTAAEEPGVADQIILLSGTGDVSNLGELPKLFVASEGEGLADQVREMAQEAPGERNEALILPGDAHAQAIFRTDQGDRLLEAIIGRLREYG